MVPVSGQGGITVDQNPRSIAAGIALGPEQSSEHTTSGGGVTLASWVGKLSVLLAMPLLVLVAAGVFPSPVRANSPANGPSFDTIVHNARLITLIDVMTASSDGAAVLRVEHVFKGIARTTLTFGPDDKAVALRRGQHVVIAQMDPRGLDFRGTTVWVVGPDGRLSNASVVGQPTTLAEIYAYFSVPATDSMPTPPTAAPRASARPMIVVGVFLAFTFALALLWSSRVASAELPKPPNSARSTEDEGRPPKEPR